MACPVVGCSGDFGQTKWKVCCKGHRLYVVILWFVEGRRMFCTLQRRSGKMQRVKGSAARVCAVVGGVGVVCVRGAWYEMHLRMLMAVIRTKI